MRLVVSSVSLSLRVKNTVQLEASRDILGLKESGGVTVNVGIQSNTTITPGLVLRDPRPHSQTIDATISQSVSTSSDAGEV